MDATPPETPEPKPFEAPKAPLVPARNTSAVVVSLLVRLAVGLLIVLASLIAFVATCFPIGFLGMAGLGGKKPETVMTVACVIGGTVAIGVGYFLSRALRQPSK